MQKQNKENRAINNDARVFYEARHSCVIACATRSRYIYIYMYTTNTHEKRKVHKDDPFHSLEECKEARRFFRRGTIKGRSFSCPSNNTIASEGSPPIKHEPAGQRGNKPGGRITDVPSKSFSEITIG